MRLKASLAPVLSAVMILFGCLNLKAQVAPAARIGGMPIGIGVGMSGYYLDYGPGRWMEGPVIRASLGIFHGIGVDGDIRSIFMNTPSDLQRMQQTTYLGGVFYQAPAFHKIRPFARFGAGVGVIEFPSRNPFYTRDSLTVYAPSAGIEYPIAYKLNLRAEYEYQYWLKYQGPRDLNPQGVTLGATYYLRGRHPRNHYAD